MGAYIIRRVLQGMVVLLLISFLTFIVLRAAPGDPIEIMLGEGAVQLTPEQREAILDRWGLNDPWYTQYMLWLRNFVTGNLGESIVRSGVPVFDMIRPAAIETLKLNALATLLSTMVSIPAGMLAAIKRYSIFDSLTMVGASVGIAMPNFWVGLMLIILFSLQLGWLPPFGAQSWEGYVLPVFVLAINETALLTRLMRGTMLEVMDQDYITTARSKGVGRFSVVVHHALRNALLPIITILGLRIAFLVSGSVVVESVFSWPGLGTLLISSIERFDFQVVQAIVMLLTVFVLVANILTDLLYAVVDPRIRLR